MEDEGAHEGHGLGGRPDIGDRVAAPCRVFSGSAQPPQMSTTGSPWWNTATEAPRSAPLSSWAWRVDRTGRSAGRRCRGPLPCLRTFLAVSGGPRTGLAFRARTRPGPHRELIGRYGAAPTGRRRRGRAGDCLYLIRSISSSRYSLPIPLSSSLYLTSSLHVHTRAYRTRSRSSKQLPARAGLYVRNGPSTRSATPCAQHVHPLLVASPFIHLALPWAISVSLLPRPERRVRAPTSVRADSGALRLGGRDGVTPGPRRGSVPGAGRSRGRPARTPSAVRARTDALGRRPPGRAPPFRRRGVPSARHVARRFTTDAGRALIAFTSAHSVQPLYVPVTAAFALLATALCHVAGWPVVEGGSAAIGTGLAAEIRRRRGVVHTAHPVVSLNELPRARAVLLDVSPRQFLSLAGTLFLRRRRARERATVPVLLRARSIGRFTDRCPRATKPASGRCQFTCAAPSKKWRARRPRWGRSGTPSGRSSVQPSPAWSTRRERPSHVTHYACTATSQTCRTSTCRTVWRRRSSWFAPCFLPRVLSLVVRPAAEAEAHNPNLLGGDVNGGAATLRQTLFLPVAR